MENVVLVIHLILAVTIIGLVLIQRSEGGGLGIGGGGGGLGSFASARGTASALTRMTAFFAACFFVTSLTLAIMAGAHHKSGGILETYAPEEKTIAVPTDSSVTAAPAESTDTSETTAPKTTVTPDVAENGPADQTLELKPDAESATPEPEEKPSVPIGD
ncbi:MAG: preprotein translocase subunit SecG [Rhodospirillales bacterium]|nr:preprotein translocase subunit SecG [Rhodospirillales bacterium]MCB9980717.1 preprotein translocase subunit SecG [Rhodospirillales bacterium]